MLEWWGREEKRGMEEEGEGNGRRGAERKRGWKRGMTPEVNRMRMKKRRRRRRRRQT